MYAPHHLEQANTMFGPKIQGSNQGQQAQDKVWLIEDLAFANPRHGSPDGMATLLSDPDPTSPIITPLTPPRSPQIQQKTQDPRQLPKHNTRPGSTTTTATSC